MDWKLELVIIPVSDVDRAKAFYERVGFNADHDHTVTPELRFVQLTPPGSACSIALGTGLTDAPLGSARAQVVVADVEKARAELIERGIETSDVERLDWGAFVFFNDPDGNRWSLQESTPPAPSAA
jgi:catechol 2,3-dioxygenase-like lactoylglutathione lyase family enzyme